MLHIKVESTILTAFKILYILYFRHSSQATEDSSWFVDESDVTSDETLSEEGEDLSKVITNHLGSLSLKLDCIFNVPSRCIDEIVEELQFITRSASAPVIKNIVHDT